jgi:site-specific recombinase XerD
MPTIKLTNRAVARIPAPDPSGKQKLMWDSELKGFGLLISGVTSSKSYVAQRTLDDGRTRRVTIGSVAEIDLDRARAMAADLIHQLRHGIDPKAARRSAANWTLRRALDEYLKARKSLRPKSVSSYRHWLGKHLDAWMDRPMRTITADEVEERHRAIQAEIGKRRKMQPDHFKSESGTRTANQVLRIFGQLWNFVGDRDPTFPANPVRRLKRQWFDEPRRTRLVKADQLPAFYAGIEALQHPVYRDCIKFLLFTGMRRTEAASLRWDMVDFAAKVIRVPADTKTETPLNLPMSSFVRALLIDRRALGDSGWVFPGQRGKPIGEPSDYFKAIAGASAPSTSPNGHLVHGRG